MYNMNFLNDYLSFLKSICCAAEERDYKPIKKKIMYKHDEHYEGQMRNKLRHGKGWYYYKNKDFYYGQWVNDEKHGYGQFYYHTGDLYKGYWKNGVKQGFGEYFKNNGDRYKGYWINGRKHGKGIYYYSDFCEYRGTFFEDKKDGKGLFIDSEDNVVMEVWNRGTFITKIRSSKKRQNLGSFECMCKSIEEKEFAEELQPDIQLFNSKTENLVSPNKLSSIPKPAKQADAETDKKTVDPPSSLFGRLTNFKSRNYDSISLGEYKEQLDSFYEIVKEKEIREWKTAEISNFLDKIDMGEYKQVFSENGITGEVLLKIKRKDLKSLGVVKGDQIIIIDAVRKLDEINTQEKRRKIFLKKNLIANTKVMSIEEKFLSYFDKNDNDLIEEASNESSASNSSKEYSCRDVKSRGKKYKERTINFDITSPKRSDLVRDRKKKVNYRSHHNLSENDDFQAKEALNRMISDVFDSKLKEKSQKHILTKERSRTDKIIGQFDSDKNHHGSSSSDEQNNKLRLKKEKSKRSNMYNKPSIQSLSQYMINKSSLKITAQLQEGAFGKVYLGEYINQKVAIKVYKKHQNKKIHVESFLKEVDILNSLRHPNILLYMGICFDRDNYLMIAEYLENGSLFDHLHREDTYLSESLIFEMITSILKAMTYTHSKNILHCDLKSSNILIDQNWIIKVADFGLSKKIIKFNTGDEKKGKVGTPNWMAPEICRGEKNTEKADVYAFGLIVWEIVTKKIPFEKYSYAQIMAMVGYSQKIEVS